MGHTFNGFTKEEWVFDMGCELDNLLAGEYPDDGEALSYGIRTLLYQYEGLVTQDLKAELEGEERLTSVPDEMVQRWASLRGEPCWTESAGDRE